MTAWWGRTFATFAPVAAAESPRTFSDGYWSASWYVAPTFSASAIPIRRRIAASSSGTSARKRAVRVRQPRSVRTTRER